MFDFLKRKPDYVVPHKGDDRSVPAINRWHLIPRNNWFNIYLHETVRDNDPIGLHDHPYWNLSIVLKGGYWEYRAVNPLSYHEVGQWAHVASRNYSPHLRALKAQAYQELEKVWWPPISVVLRRPTDAHRLELADVSYRDRVENCMSTRKCPAWSLFITGPRVRVWGFWLPDGWVPFDKVKG